MSIHVGRELAALERLGVNDLRAKYGELFGEATRTGNKAWLVRRIVWRMQALAEGDLTERARRRAAELANDADLRMNAPKVAVSAPVAGSFEPTGEHVLRFRPDDRLPPPGTVLTREYKGQVIQARVLESGFEYAGKVYKSLSAVARAVTRSHCNGYFFFRLGNNGGTP